MSKRKQPHKRNFGKVAVLMGGPSTEREISLKSGNAILTALRRRGVDAHGIDPDHNVARRLREGGYERVFIALHGRWGEDGVIQGALEVMGLPYTGSGVLGSALGLDKLRCKRIWECAGIPTPDYALLGADTDLNRVTDDLGFPLIVKPVREGSSLGITKVQARAELEAARDSAARFDDYVMVERCIEGEELTATILGDEVLPLIRVETPRDFYDYEAKYVLDTTRYHCPCGLDADTEKSIQELARRAFEAVGCGGWGRVDFMRDVQGNTFVLEVNTVPGMTDHSLVPKAAAQAGMSFDELVLRILETSDVAR